MNPGRGARKVPVVPIFPDGGMRGSVRIAVGEEPLIAPLWPAPGSAG